MHRALNASAGEVLFEPGLERFIGANPVFRAERDTIARFMQVSREVFFAGAWQPGSAGAPASDSDALSSRSSFGERLKPPREADEVVVGTGALPRNNGDPIDAAWLIELCRRCREAERAWGGAR